MNREMTTVLIVFVCMIILLIGALRGKLEWLLNLVMRSILGTVAIYFINMGLDNFGISLGVGINAASVLTSGILGFPGVVALYAIGIYHLL